MLFPRLLSPGKLFRSRLLIRVELTVIILKTASSVLCRWASRLLQKEQAVVVLGTSTLPHVMETYSPLGEVYKTSKYQRVHDSLPLPQNLALGGEHVRPHYMVKFGGTFEAYPKYRYFWKLCPSSRTASAVVTL